MPSLVFVREVCWRLSARRDCLRADACMAFTSGERMFSLTGRRWVQDSSVMAKTIITRTTDDLDGSEGALEVSFAYEGVHYTIDLTKKNKAAFEKVLKPYLAAATKESARPRRESRRAASRAAGTRSDLAEIRAWAKQKGMKVSDRGRVSREVTEAYDAR